MASRVRAFRRHVAAVVGLALVVSLASCSEEPTRVNPGVPEEAYSGGATTIFDATTSAFSLPAPNLTATNFSKHADGDVAFDRTFVTAPAPRFGGLGPVFNQASCRSCHIGNGRGTDSRLIRLSLAGVAEDGGPMPVPGFGRQLQDRAIQGKHPEGATTVTWEERDVQFQDGTSVRLRRPIIQVIWAGAPAPAGTLMSPRVAPAVFGLGLLEAIPEAEILALAASGPTRGVSGRPNYVWDVAANRVTLGRFGWKANEPNLLQQTADAYNADMGITSPVRPIESSADQGQDDHLSDDPEVDAQTLEVTAFYVRTLGVPARRSLDDPLAMHGESLFREAGCASCHVPRLETGDVPGLPEISRQTIFPYTDLLLHDMGEDLADDRPDFQADGQEWRTPPLWGIGLLELVNGRLQLLHDGRAASFLEAVLWHGGEAEASRERVLRMPADERSALIAFLRSL